MKLFGNNRKRKGLTKKYTSVSNDKNVTRSRIEQAEIDRMITVYQKKKKRRRRRVLVTLLILLTLMISTGVYFNSQIKPPDVNTNHRSDTTDDPNASGDEPAEVRNTEKYTFVVLGQDDGNGNTDTMMVVTFDTTNYTLDVVSIPRDTLVNVSWSVKKANTLYSACDGDMDAFNSKLADLLGFEVDFYVIVDLEAFSELVDAVDGIYYDVPRDMDYEDPAQDLYIHIDAGYQLLSGDDALKVVRYRKGYATGDIGRIETQQDFLASAAAQIIENKDSINVTTIARIFLEYVDTDLTSGNLIWFAKEFFKMDSENIRFHSLPGNYGDSVHQGSYYVSYVTIYVDEWLDIINDYLNPFNDPIMVNDLNLLTRDENGKLYATSGIREGSSSWGSSSGSSSSSSSSDDKPTVTDTPVVTDDPAETPDPVVSESPVASETPVVSESPAVSETPIVSESPAVTDNPDSGGT